MITVSMAAVIDAPRERVWRALTSPQELIRWDDRVVTLAGRADRGGRRPGPRQRYRLGSVWVDLRYRPLEVVRGRRLRSEVSLGLFRFEATYTLAPDDGEAAQTHLSLRLAFSNSVPVVGGCVDRFDLRRLASELVSENISALQRWCERSPAARDSLSCTCAPADRGRGDPMRSTSRTRQAGAAKRRRVSGPDSAAGLPPPPEL
ncbi:MAG TPA: SRPBCC domain-containing protein [Myxococcota bacterium]